MRKLISAQQTCERLGTSRPTLSRIKDEIGYYRVGRKLKFTEESISAYLDRVHHAAQSTEQMKKTRGGNN